MSIKEQLFQEIEQISEHLISELLDLLLLLKKRYNNEITEQEKINIAISLKDYQAGDYITLEEYEEKQR